MEHDGKTRQAAYAGWKAEATFGFAQAVRFGDAIHVSGQAGLREDGELVSAAPLDDRGRPTDLSGMEPQIRAAYACAARVLGQFGATLSDVVQETIFTLDVPSTFAVGGAVRKEVYGTDRPAVASNLIGTPGLAIPGQLVEIAFVAYRAS